MLRLTGEISAAASSRPRFRRLPTQSLTDSKRPLFNIMSSTETKSDNVAKITVGRPHNFAVAAATVTFEG